VGDWEIFGWVASRQGVPSSPESTQFNSKTPRFYPNSREITQPKLRPNSNHPKTGKLFYWDFGRISPRKQHQKTAETEGHKASPPFMAQKSLMNDHSVGLWEPTASRVFSWPFDKTRCPLEEFPWPLEEFPWPFDKNSWPFDKKKIKLSNKINHLKNKNQL